MTVRSQALGWIRRATAQPDGPGMFGTYVGMDRVLIRLPRGRHILAVASDLSLTPTLLTHGMYDGPFWRFLHRHLKPGDRAVDVGANIGLFTIAMADLVGPSGHVTAYEPDPTLADLLRDNVLSNWLADRVTVVQSAAGPERGVAVFARHPKFLGSSSAGTADLIGHSASTGLETADVATIEVPIERVDERLSGPVRLVKIDVEGGEAGVLNGMDGIQPELLDVEVRRDIAHDWDALVRTLHALPGSPHRINHDGSLSSVTLERVIDVGNWSHVVFA